MTRRGLLLFAHGARDPRWAEPFEAVVQRARAADAGVQVKLGFLELMSPSLPEAGRELAEAGCEHVDIVPLFLGAGGHVRKDIPALVGALEQTWPAVRWRLRTAVGESPLLIAAMAEIALEHVREPPVV